jgi:hypothetical protein
MQVGTLSELLMKKKEYIDQICGMLQQYVFPELKAPQGHLRARVCFQFELKWSCDSFFSGLQCFERLHGH